MTNKQTNKQNGLRWKIIGDLQKYSRAAREQIHVIRTTKGMCSKYIMENYRFIFFMSHAALSSSGCLTVQKEQTNNCCKKYKIMKM